VALTQVEERLGQKLFVRRKGTPISLTRAGEAYIKEVDDLLAAARRLEEPDLLKGSISGVLTLGIFDDLAPFYLVPLLKALSRALPDVEVRYRIADFETLARGMLEEQVDLSVTYNLGLDGSFSKKDLMLMKPWVFVEERDVLANQKWIALEDLAQRSLVLFKEGLSIRHFLGLFRQVGARPIVRHRVRSLEVMRSLVGGGEGVGLSYSKPPYDRVCDGNSIRAIPISNTFAQEPVVLAYNVFSIQKELVKKSGEVISSVMGG